MASRLSAVAETELDQIWYYVTKETGVETADRLIDSITTRILLLSRSPRIGRRRDDLRPGLRSFAVGQYIIIYRITEEGDVIVLHIAHGRRNLENLFGS